jgi:hypothetical protein
MQVKPIETVFDGHRFRSRLEARWAVAFKALRLPYEYEIEGFELSGGVRYLPDFYLPTLKVFVEIKPRAEIGRDAWEKIVRFSANGEQNLLLIVGPPAKHEMRLFTPASADPWEFYSDDSDTNLDCLLWVETEEFQQVEFGTIPLCTETRLVYVHPQPFDQCHLNEALLTGLQARFEHGARG